MGIDTFAFIAHPLTIEQLREYWQFTKLLPDGLIKVLLKNLAPFKVSEINGIRSIKGKEIRGYLIACPLLPQQMLDLEEKIVLDKIICAGHIAEKLGAQIVGLGGYTSIAADKGYSVAKNLKIAVTSGNAYTAWSVFEAIYRAVKVNRLDFKKSTFAIIGATGSIGSLCARKLSEYAVKIIITARHRDKLERLREEIIRLNPVEVAIEEDAHKAAREADIVITTTSAPQALLKLEEFKPNSIVCDVSVPKNITGACESEKNVILIRGGLIKMPHPVDFGVKTGLPDNVIYACMAETMLLTLEKRFEDYSLGDNIDLDKMEEIADIAAKHGFEVWAPEAPVL